MNLTIHPLGPENASLYIDYLENLDFHHAPDWSGCFCRFYHNDCSNEVWMKRTAAENKAEALFSIQDGSMKGFLAFNKDQVIGWVNANTVDRYPRLKGFVEAYVSSPKTACIVCFVIHPEYRRQGVARALLKRVIEHYRTEGYDAVLAFPFENKDEPEKAYRGSSSMYLELGFTIVESRNNMSVMRKDLNP
jgi:GNAT superfamily N-acetyltransferase